jgi:hypothetical protein
MVLQYVCGAGIAFVIVAFFFEMHRWKLPGSLVTKRQKSLRVIIAFLLETLFCMVLWGPIRSRWSDPISELMYWTLCFAVSFAVLACVILDVKETAKA